MAIVDLLHLDTPSFHAAIETHYGLNVGREAEGDLVIDGCLPSWRGRVAVRELMRRARLEKD